MADTKISALPAASTPLTGSEVVPLNQSGVTSNVTVANLTAGRNITFNNTLPGYTTTATAAGTTTLTSSSTYHQRFTGSSAQTLVLPAATTMAQGQGFVIDNDSSGTLTLQDGSTASLGSVTAGMAAYIFCENNSTTAGSWSGYMFVPGSGPGGQITWGTAGLAMGGQALSGVNTISSASATALTLQSAGTTAITIDTSQNLLVGASSTNTGRTASKLYTQTVANQDTCQLSQSSNSYFNLYSYVTTSSGTRYHVGFCDATGGAGGVVGTISTNGSSTTYATSSDYRLKENIAPMTNALSSVVQLKPCTFTWKNTGIEDNGFIAHELQNVLPNAVVGEKDAVDADGKPIYQQIDTSFLVATLTAAIQELSAQVTALQTQVTALKG